MRNTTPSHSTAKGIQDLCRCVLALLVLLVLPVWAQDHYPAPQGRVNDFAQVLDTTSREKLNALIAEVEQRTTAEIAVVVVTTTAPETPKQYVTELFKRWGVGKKGADNGVMILLVIRDRRVEIETGYGVEGILPDGKLGEIIRTAMVPDFKNNRWAAGLLAGTQQVAQVLLSHAQEVRATAPRPALPRGQDVVLSVLGWGYLLAWLIFLLVRNVQHRVLSSSIAGVSALLGIGWVIFAVSVLLDYIQTAPSGSDVPTRFGFQVLFPFLVLYGFGVYAVGKNIHARCPNCRGWLSRRQNTVKLATATEGGLRERIADCEACGYHNVQLVHTSPQMATSSWGGSHGSFWGGSNGGGSFGGGSSGGGGAGADF